MMKNELHRSTLKTIETINEQKLHQQNNITPNSSQGAAWSVQHNKKNVIIRNTLFLVRIANRFPGCHACSKCTTSTLEVAMFMCRLRCVTRCGFRVWCIFDKPVILLEFHRLLYSVRQRQIIRGTNTYVKVVYAQGYFYPSVFYWVLEFVMQAAS